MAWLLLILRCFLPFIAGLTAFTVAFIATMPRPRRTIPLEIPHAAVDGVYRQTGFSEEWRPRRQIMLRHVLREKSGEVHLFFPR